MRNYYSYCLRVFFRSPFKRGKPFVNIFVCSVLENALRRRPTKHLRKALDTLGPSGVFMGGPRGPPNEKHNY